MILGSCIFRNFYLLIHPSCFMPVHVTIACRTDISACFRAGCILAAVRFRSEEVRMVYRPTPGLSVSQSFLLSGYLRGTGQECPCHGERKGGKTSTPFPLRFATCPDCRRDAKGGLAGEEAAETHHGPSGAMRMVRGRLKQRGPIYYHKTDGSAAVDRRRSPSHRCAVGPLTFRDDRADP